MHSIRFDAPCTMPVAQPMKGYESIIGAMKFGTTAIPEGLQLTSVITLFPQKLGLTDEQAAGLRNNFAEVYAKMATDPEFAGITSVLSEGVDDNPNRPGHYFAYIPAQPSAKTQTLVFLHGFGGNFQFYIYLLKQAFPDSIIICPTWGMSWYNGDLAFVSAVCSDVSRRFAVTTDRRWLLALSAGGPAGFRELTQNPAKYRGFVCLASCPDSKQVLTVPRDKPVLMLAGLRDSRIPVRYVRERSEAIIKNKGTLDLVELDADHFFMLTQPEKTFTSIKEFMSRQSALPVSQSAPNTPYWLTRFILPWFFTAMGLIFLGYLVVLRRRKRKKAKN